MSIEILHRYTRAVLYRSEDTKTIREALEHAVRSEADLSRADLYGADLSGADLYGAKGVGLLRSTSLAVLLDQPGKIRAYKLTQADGQGPYNGGITYEVGQTYEVADADIDEAKSCGAGINVATMDWCLREWRTGFRVFVVEFEASDIAAIPIGTDGKFRLHRCTVVAERDDVAELAEGGAS